MKTVIIDQTGNRYEGSTVADKHARTHKLNGTDAISIAELGGLTSKEIHQLFKRVERTCKDYTNFYSLLDNYAKLGTDGKVPISLLPDGLLTRGYIEYVANYPGTIKTVDTFDIIPVRAACKVVGVSATLAAKPDVDIDIIIKNGDTVLTKPNGTNLAILQPASTEYSRDHWEDNDPHEGIFTIGANGTIQVGISVPTGVEEPGEFLTVRILTSLIN